MATRTRSRTNSSGGSHGLAAFVRWLIGKIAWIAGVVVLVVLVIGAFKASPLIGGVVGAIALVIAYFMVRERR